MQNTYKAMFVVMVVGLLIMRPSLSYADWNGHNNNGHGSYSHNDGHGYSGGHGHSYVGVNLGIWPEGYYYGAPYYPPADQVLISPPDYEPVIVNGTTYYLYDGTYYVYNGYGYEPIAPPVTVVQQPVTVIPPSTTVINQVQPAASPIVTTDAAAGPLDSITINIPNNKGGYTAVTLKRSGNGYTGPQGEFYPEFPKVSQLKVIYGNQI